MRFVREGPAVRSLARNPMFAIIIATFVSAMLLGLAGVARPLTNAVEAFGFAVRGHAASGTLVVVEMDAASVAAIDRWPWSRRHYATLIDQLRKAGAKSITFDVEFSTPSTPADDRVLAKAIRRAGGTVVLPTFAQPARHNDRRSIDALPVEALRENAVLASVSVDPDSDGLVRQMLLGTITAGTPRPSLSAYIAHRSGRADVQFPIDYSIDPSSIPRLSFIDVEQRRTAPSAVRGKDVLIGATAVEIGDRYAAPRYGVLPGVVVQALAAETLFETLPKKVGGIPALLIALLVSMLIARSNRVGRAVGLGLVGTVGLLVLHWLGWRTGYVIDCAPGLIMLLSVTGARLLDLMLRNFRHRRLHDSATGLPNRNALAHSMQAVSAGIIVAAVIDNYDRLAAVLGDAETASLINRVAERLNMATGGAAVHRVEDRVLAWPGSNSFDQLEQGLVGAAQLMRAPIEAAGRRVDVTIGFGIAPALAEATLAAAEAVERQSIWHYHAEGERALLDRNISLMGELDAAIENGELSVVYQPKLDLAADAVTSAEALVRWNHPALGFLSPDAFIPMAEKNDRIEGLTLYVLRQAVSDMVAWRTKGLDLRVAVNISARLVACKTFGGAVHKILSGMPFPADRLIFEVTESATLDDPEAAAAALHAFSAMGVTVSMDDYGTGQSTLGYLRQLPLTELKIDRSFVQHAHQNRGDAVLVRSTVELAHELSIRVVAEGVEDEECLAFLRSVGCDYAQGYHVGKPMAVDQLFELAHRECRNAA